MESEQARGVALVIGAGDATGGAIARRFAQGGYTACLTRRSADKLQPLVERIRSEGHLAFGYGSDARKEEEVTALFDSIEREHGPVDAAGNVGADENYWYLHTQPRDAWTFELDLRPYMERW